MPTLDFRSVTAEPRPYSCVIKGPVGLGYFIANLSHHELPEHSNRRHGGAARRPRRNAEIAHPRRSSVSPRRHMVWTWRQFRPVLGQRNEGGTLLVRRNGES